MPDRFENLDTFGGPWRLGRHKARARAHELLDDFGLFDAANRPVKTYSRRMRRRLDLAGALVAKPQVLFLNEPTTGVDPGSRADMWEVIRWLVGHGTTLLLTTQSMEEADQLPDEIVVVDHGRAIAHGTSDQLKEQLGGERIELVVEHEADLVQSAEILDGFSVNAVQLDAKRRSVTAPVAGGAKAWSKVPRVLEAESTPLSDVGWRRPTLDDVFLTLTGHNTLSPKTNGTGGAASPESRETDRNNKREPVHRRSQGGCPMRSLLWVAANDVAVAKRNLIKIKRVPDVLVWVLVSPIIFLCCCSCTSWELHHIHGVPYREWLIAGIFVQTVVFGATYTGYHF